MDSLSQLVLGAAVAAACVPARHRRKALLVGAALGTLPDLDVLIDYGDAVSNMTMHRGFSHSLIVLPGVALLLWVALRAGWAPVREAPWRWLLAIVLALVTHPLLDAFTVYGTQLFWPLTTPPLVGGSMFIIDPLYTLPLLVAVIVAMFAGAERHGGVAVALGLALSTGYLGWSLVAQQRVDAIAAESLRGTPHADAPRLVIAMPFNTILWRVVVMTPEGFLEGERSLWADRGPMQWRAHRSDVDAWNAVRDLPAAQRLLWFNRGFMKAERRDGEVVLTDLRMGAEPDYTFRFAVARWDGEGEAIAVEPRQKQWPWQASRRLTQLWERIWTQPTDQAADANAGTTPATSASK
ncbi:MAG: metal-dependent hydrolase [Silanimonas sp.]